ncbi:MAG TPA: Spy/CpxP family protein refolding chaperone [Salinivirgaceae bacterium]|nr:Spy/CpxP family protein refolding chaperone [Salinivirgaceae bacterium]
MKPTILLTTLFLSVWMMGAKAQPHEPGACCRNLDNIPNLTEEQKSKLETLKVEHLKKMTSLKAEMEKLRAEKHALMVAEKPDKKAIDAIIEKMGQQYVAMQKETANHRLAVREIFTPEQRVYFDACPHFGKRGFMNDANEPCPGGKGDRGQGGFRHGCGK